MASDWLFSASELRRTPSQSDGVALDAELLRRSAACRLIGRMGGSLRLSLAAQRAACVFLHRFFMRRSLTQYNERLVAAACVLVSSKTEEDSDQVTVSRLATALGGQKEMEETLLQLEGDVLLALSFELEVDHSFAFVGREVDAVAALLPPQQRQKLQQAAWSFLNDSANTWACLIVDAQVMAKAAVYAAGLFDGTVPSHTMTKERRPWWTVLETPLRTLKDAARHVLAAYSAPFIETSALPVGLIELVSMFPNETCESSICEPEVPESAQFVPLKVEIDAEILFQGGEESPANDDAFVEQSTAWIDDCVLSTKGWKGEESPCDVETCSQRPLALKRSLSVTDHHIVKRVKLLL